MDNLIPIDSMIPLKAGAYNSFENMHQVESLWLIKWLLIRGNHWRPETNPTKNVAKAKTNVEQKTLANNRSYHSASNA